MTKITLPNGITIEEPTTEILNIVLGFNSSTTQPKVEKPKSLQKMANLSKKSTCNNILTEEQRLELTYSYFNKLNTVAQLVNHYKVSRFTITYHVQNKGLAYGYLTSKKHHSLKYSDIWNVKEGNKNIKEPLDILSEKNTTIKIK